MVTQSLNKALKLKEPFLYQTIFDMQRKNYLPERFRIDDNIFGSLVQNQEMETFKQHSCMTCGITIIGPKKLLLEHHKIHSDNKVKENEVFKGRYLEYM